MSLPGTEHAGSGQSLVLVVRRTINASADRLFTAWTDPVQLSQWWGPRGVTCAAAEIDLTIGGCYRIVNRLADGSTLGITGTFEQIERPNKLVYSWQREAQDQEAERVTVQFRARAAACTEVIISHERITDPAIRAGHEHGWQGCLDGLVAYLAPM